MIKKLLRIRVERQINNTWLHVQGDSSVWHRLADKARTDSYNAVITYYPLVRTLESASATLESDWIRTMERPSIFCVLAKDLDAGVAFDLGSTPRSETWLLKLQQQIKDAAIRVYREYLRPLDKTVTLTTETSEIIAPR